MTKYLKLGLVLASLLVGLLTLVACSTVSPGQTPSSSGFDWTFLIILAVFILAAYLFMIRPQRNQQKRQQKLLNELNPGDKVITSGGIYGEVDSQDENSVLLKVESGAKIRVSRASIAGKRSSY